MIERRRRTRGTICAVNGCAAEDGSVITRCCSRLVWSRTRDSRPEDKGAALAPGKADFEPEEVCACGSRDFLVAGVCVNCRNNRGQVFEEGV